jgi:hypothetical protein
LGRVLISHNVSITSTGVEELNLENNVLSALPDELGCWGAGCRVWVVGV